MSKITNIPRLQTATFFSCLCKYILLVAQLKRAAIFVAYKKHQTANKTKAEQNRASHLSCVARTDIRKHSTSSEQVFSRVDLDNATQLLRGAMDCS